jgi:hypothetical protein
MIRACGGTVATIERELMVDGLVRRYRSNTEVDGLPPGEGVFLPCSFWLADSYTLQNRHAEARALFGGLLSLRNDVGLLAEEYDPLARRQVGNFPQAFSHLALIGTALNLHEVGSGQRRNQRARRSRPQCAQSSAKGFLSERLTGAELLAVRIMSMRARNVAGTCRCPE